MSCKGLQGCLHALSQIERFSTVKWFREELLYCIVDFIVTRGFSESQKSDQRQKVLFFDVSGEKDFLQFNRAYMLSVEKHP